MEYFQLQGRLGLVEPVYSSYKRASKNQSLLVLGVIIFAHVMIILLMLNEKVRHRESVPEKFFHMINLLPEPIESIPEPDKPEVIQPRLWQPTTPPIQFSEPVQSQLDIPFNDSYYKFPLETSNQYEHIFDPKMRKKLIDAQKLNAPRKATKPNSWTTGDGRIFTDMGNGICMVSDLKPKTDWRDRGTSYNSIHCGKTDSEKMMDNVNADLEARKHPLKTQ